MILTPVRVLAGAGTTCCPHFIRQEANQRLGLPFHGVDGQVKVSDSHHPATDISRAFLLTLQQLGLPYNSDINSGDERGATYIQSTTYRGKRWSAARAFIRPLLDNPKLTIRYRCPATHLILEKGRAIGVEYLDLNGSNVSRAYANNEIVLSAGTFITPKLLMLSGIGPAASLRSHGIDVQVNLPGVGQNMQDHNDATMIVHTTENYGYSGEDRGWPMMRNGLQYLLFGTGPVSSTGSEVTAFLNPVDTALKPTIQFYCMGTLYPARGSSAKLPFGATLVANLVAPESRGSLRLRSSNPRDLPVVDSGWLTSPNDIRTLSAGLRYLRRVTETAPFSQMVSRLAAPAPALFADDEMLASYVRSVTGTNWHPVGSCRMGPKSDPAAVLDPSLRVRGVEDLRVFDASMMPRIISANTNAPVMAIADRGVDIMMGNVG
jgi:choline dehydrogenase